jgi:hypothetical protein
MVHKKYIKKNGKIYGPYYYKSKRVGDKVISEYVGETKPREISRKNLIIGGFTLLALVFLMLVFLLINSGVFTGKSISDLGEGNSIKNIVSMTGDVINSGAIDSLETSDFSTQDSGEFSQSIRNFKNWVIVTFRMNGEVGEYSYSNSLSQEELDSLIERDKALWLEKISS